MTMSSNPPGKLAKFRLIKSASMAAIRYIKLSTQHYNTGDERGDFVLVHGLSCMRNCVFFS